MFAQLLEDSRRRGHRVGTSDERLGHVRRLTDAAHDDLRLRAALVEQVARHADNVQRIFAAILDPVPEQAYILGPYACSHDRLVDAHDRGAIDLDIVATQPTYQFQRIPPDRNLYVERVVVHHPRLP